MLSGTWNVATGQATTIRELLAEIEKLAGRSCEVIYDAQRPGDVAMSSLSVARIRVDLGWEPRVALSLGLEDALRAMRTVSLSSEPPASRSRADDPILKPD